MLQECHLINTLGTKVSLSNYGARISQIELATDSGLVPILLNYNSIENYLDDKYYIGATIGRFSNRIANAKFNLDNDTINLTKNEAENHLHGGFKGFDKQYWQVITTGDNCIVMQYISKDGEEGYPGNLQVQCKFTLQNDNQLTINFKANTDKTTVVSLTNHCYFNLNTDKSSTINNHKLCVSANYLVNKNSEAVQITNTAFDFNKLKVIENTVLDHSYNTLEATMLYSPESNILLTVSSDYPCMQIYSGDYLDGCFLKRQGFCIEPQFLPNSPNSDNDSIKTQCILKPNATLNKTITYKFSQQIL